MEISVVIPSYNRAHTLERALLSVTQQSSPVNQIIVVDDGSSDNSEQLIADNFPSVTLIRQSNQGVSAARNRGIAAARHDWIALLDSDDCWLPEKISRIREANQKNPDFVLYHSNEIWIRNGKRVNPMDKHQKYGGWIFQQCLPLCAISPSASVIKKTVFQQIGLFDTDLPACEDYDLWLRLCHQYPVYYIEEPLITKYGGHDDQLSRKFWGMDRFRIQALDRLLTKAKLNSADFDAAAAVLINKLDILLNGAIKHHNQAILAEFLPLREKWHNPVQRTATC